MKPDDPDARIKFLAEEELCRVGGPVFDASGNRVANELRRRNCVMGEMRKNKPPIPSRSKQGRLLTKLPGIASIALNAESRNYTSLVQHLPRV